MALELKNGHLIYLLGNVAQGMTGWLERPLTGKDARARSRVVKVLKEKHADFDAARLELLKNLAEKDENGEAKTKDGAFDLSPDNLKKFTADYDELVNEPCIIDVLDSNREDLKTLTEILKSGPASPMGANDGIVYEEVTERFEKAVA